MKARETMYQCIKQYGSIKTGSFWEVDRYVVNSDGERIKVIITNEENLLLLSMTEFKNHFTQVNEVLTEQEYLQTCSIEQLAELLGRIAKNAYQCGQDGKTNKCVNRKNCTGYCDYGWEMWLKQPRTDKE